MTPVTCTQSAPAATPPALELDSSLVHPDYLRRKLRDFYDEIRFLWEKNGAVRAGDAYFAGKCGVSPATVRRWLCNLVEFGLIRIQRRPGLRRLIFILPVECAKPEPNGHKTRTARVPKSHTDCAQNEQPLPISESDPNLSTNERTTTTNSSAPVPAPEPIAEPSGGAVVVVEPNGSTGEDATPQASGRTAAPADPLVEALVSETVDRSTAELWTAQYPAVCREQLKALRQARRRGSKIENPGGWLRRAIERTAVEPKHRDDRGQGAEPPEHEPISSQIVNQISESFSQAQAAPSPPPAPCAPDPRPARPRMARTDPKRELDHWTRQPSAPKPPDWRLTAKPLAQIDDLSDDEKAALEREARAWCENQADWPLIKNKPAAGRMIEAQMTRLLRERRARRTATP